MSMSAQEYDSAPNAPEEDGPPKGDIVYATKHQDDVCGKKCEFDPVTGKCLACEAMNKRAREEAEAAMARDTAE